MADGTAKDVPPPVSLQPDASAPKAPSAAMAPASRARLRLVLLVVVPLVMLIAAAVAYLAGGRYVSTDDAYVKADKITISAEISGRVVAVAVRANQHVAQGDLLFTLDAEPYRIALDRAEAQLAAARNEVESMRATLLEKQASLKAAEDSVAYLGREFDRQQQLAARSVVSASKLDEARHSLDNARQQVAIIRHDIASLLASLGGDGKIATEDHPRVREARAARDQAALDLRRTRIVAPASGMIASFDLQRGEYVNAGTPVFSLVSDERIWIEANLKETDLTWVRAGQPATVKVDAYPDHPLRATVESINAGTGAEFSLLPPQNATGNWVKVVQRVPVRLAVTPEPGLPLRTGMSVTAEIDTGHRRELPLISKALAWAARR